MCRKRSVRCTDLPTWPLEFGCLQEIYPLTQPPTTASLSHQPQGGDVTPVTIIQWTVCTLISLFYQGGIIAGRLAQSIVYGQWFRGRQVVNNVVDLVALLSLSSTLHGKRKSLQQYRTKAAYLLVWGVQQGKGDNLPWWSPSFLLCVGLLCLVWIHSCGPQLPHQRRVYIGIRRGNRDLGI